MEWLLPAGSWAFLGIIVVVLLYLLKRKATRYEVPSLLLWQKMEAVREASKPFQKLRKQWLLLLQLLLATLLAFALLRPALPGGHQGEMVLLFDVSASMQAVSDGKSRLEMAVDEALSLVERAKERDAVTILTAGSTVGQALTRSRDKQKVRSVLLGLKAENGTADMEGALSLARAMRRDVPELRIIVYSDNDQVEGDLGSDHVKIQGVGKPAVNRSVLSLRCSAQEDGLNAFARLGNYGAAAQVTVECYADGNLCDLRSISLPDGGEESIQFLAPSETQTIWVTITTPDALAMDNTRYWVAQPKRERSILLVTPGNVFLEKALALRQDGKVVKTFSMEGLGTQEYDLVIYDGQAPAELPSTGSILALAPGVEVFGIQEGEASQTSGSLRASKSALAQRLTQNLLLSAFSLRSFRPLNGGQNILTWGDVPLLSVAEKDGRRAAVLGFDLHDSNLPMKPDFPILMQNLLDYLLPEAVSAVDGAVAGDPITLVTDERTMSVQVVTPSGRKIAAGSGLFTDTGEIGIYALQETRPDNTQRVTPFVLHMAPSEADLRQVAASSLRSQGEPVERQGAGREITVFFLLAALVVLLVEWEVSRRGA